MALREAKIFKNFLIKTDIQQGVFFGMDTPFPVNVKCDNFADTVQVYNTIAAVNLFEYKYITFDGSTVFEINDCIQCDDYYTLIITLLSRIKLNTWDSDFMLSHSTFKRLSDLGFGASKWIEILGNTAKFYEQWQKEYSVVGWGIKIELSEMPQNIGAYDYSGSVSGGIIQIKNSNSGAGFLTHTMRTPNENKNINMDKFIVSQRSFVFIVPVPIGSASVFKMIYSQPIDNTTIQRTFTRYLDWVKFTQTLNALISDLTLSVELVPLSSESLSVAIGYRKGFNSTRNINPIQVSLNAQNMIEYSFNDAGVYNPTSEATTLKTIWLHGAVGCIFKDKNDVSIDYPFLVCSYGIYDTSILDNVGFVFVYDFLSINNLPLSNFYTTVFINLLGSTIEVNGKIEDENVFLQTREHGLRLYLNYDMRDYADLENSIEFDKSAYSNYQAYSKANLQLVQRQQVESLKEQQKQDEKAQTLSQIQTGVSAVSQAGKAGAQAAMGGPFAALGAAASSLVGSATDMVFSQISFNQKQQNERANLKLQQQHALESLRATIVAGSILAGAINISDIIKFDVFGRPQSFGFTVVELNAYQLIKLYEYLINNNYITYEDPYTGALQMPDYTPDGKPILCMFTASPTTNNKSFVALCKPYTE